MIRFTPDSEMTEALQDFLKAWESDASDIVCKTSGSTGVPKEIPVSKNAMWYSALTTVRYFNLKPTDTALLCLPCDFIAGRMMLVRAQAAGMLVHSVLPSANPLGRDLVHKIHFAAFTPPQVTAALADPVSKKRLSEIDTVIIGGAALPPDVEFALAELGNRIFVTYGMTETLSHVAARRVGEDMYTLLSPDTQISVDQDGCLILRNENLFDGELKTNDLVKLVGGNKFRWIGRRDFVINSGGVKIHPEQLEKKIAGVKDWQGVTFFIGAEPNSRFGERPILIVEGNGKIPDLDSLKAILSKIEIPDRVVRVGEFKYTPNGKIDRKATLLKALQE